jgi:hypothetical protein
MYSDVYLHPLGSESTQLRSVTCDLDMVPRELLRSKNLNLASPSRVMFLESSVCTTCSFTTSCSNAWRKKCNTRTCRSGNVSGSCARSSIWKRSSLSHPGYSTAQGVSAEQWRVWGGRRERVREGRTYAGMATGRETEGRCRWQYSMPPGSKS